MSYLKLLMIPLLGLLTVALAGCPVDDEPDTTVTSIDTTPDTTVITPPDRTPPQRPDVNVNIEVQRPTEYVVVEPEVRQENPEVVVAVERQIRYVNEDPTSIEMAFAEEAPARTVWVEQIRTEQAARPVYQVERMTIRDAGDDEATAEVVMIAVPGPDVDLTTVEFEPRRVTADYIFHRQDGNWVIWDIQPTNTVVLTDDEVRRIRTTWGGTATTPNGMNDGLGNDTGTDDGTDTGAGNTTY